MQTFLPYPDFQMCADVLDHPKRLGKQRLEGRDCWVVCTEIKPDYMSEEQYHYIFKKYRHHPIVAMWKDYEEALKLYTNIIIDKWSSTRSTKTGKLYVNNIPKFDINYDKLVYPSWLGREDIHSSHRAALLYKNYGWYSQFGWGEEPRMEYIWIK